MQAEVIYVSEKEYRALRDALASSRMEGYTITAQTEQDCARLLRGEISVAALVQEIVTRR